MDGEILISSGSLYLFVSMMRHGDLNGYICTVPTTNLRIDKSRKTELQSKLLSNCEIKLSKDKKYAFPALNTNRPT